jgi:hypothetical protein
MSTLGLICSEWLNGEGLGAADMEDARRKWAVFKKILLDRPQGKCRAK